MYEKCYPLLDSFFVASQESLFGAQYGLEGYVKRFHTGLDLQSYTNRTIVSVTVGEVSLISKSKGYGNFVWVKNDDGTAAIYCHLASVSCKVGQKVSCKTPLGVMGNTGNCALIDTDGDGVGDTGVIHLHIGITTNQDYYTNQHTSEGTWINPAAYLGMSQYGDIAGKTFDGSGMITGGATGITSATSVSNASNASSTIASSIVSSGEYYETTEIYGTESDWLYGRRYRVIVDIGDGNALDVSDLRCKFKITKVAYDEPQKSTIQIYNLSPDTENKIIKSGQRVILEAGYSGANYGKIFEGNIIQPLRSKENGTDYILTLVCMNSYYYLVNSIVNMTLSAQQTSREAISACVNRAGVVTKENYGMREGTITDTQIKYPRGKILFGNPSQYLKQIANTESATYYIDGSEINIVAAPDIAEDEIVDLSPETGLINSPTQIQYGISCTCLINPRLKLNSLFHIDNSRVINEEQEIGTAYRSLDGNGIYRIVKMVYTGDTRGNDWKIDIEAISQAGILPSMVSGASSFMWG